MSKTKISNTKRIQILNRDGNKCLWCGRSIVDGAKLEVDHIISEHFDGSSDLDNLGTLCNLCNNGKGGNIMAIIFYQLSLKFRIFGIGLKSFQKKTHLFASVILGV